MTSTMTTRRPPSESTPSPSMLYSQARLRPVHGRTHDDGQSRASFHQDAAARAEPAVNPRFADADEPLSSSASTSVQSANETARAGIGRPFGRSVSSRDRPDLQLNFRSRSDLISKGAAPFGEQNGMTEGKAAYHNASSGLDEAGVCGDEESTNEEDGYTDSELGEGGEEYVVALHDFTSNNATCLSFVSGQVIKVFNRDESGWWDGELDGQRGWFPSNYVDEGGLTSDMSHGDDEEDDDGARRSIYGQSPAGTTGSSVSLAWTMPPNRLRTETPASSSSQHTATYATTMRSAPPPQLNGGQSSRSPTPTANSIMQASHRNAAASRELTGHERDMDDQSRLPSILEPIKHAISLLHNAVRANRIAHFQPSTACVISSVRSVLSSTDCLTRESNVLKAHPVLAKERKQILAELSKLVTQARRASAPMQDNEAQYAEMESMLQLADQVLFNVRRFLDVAVECDVTIPDRHASVYDDMYDDGRLSSGIAGHPPSRQGGAHPNRVDLDKTPTPDSPRSSTYRTAFTSDHISPRSSRSYVDLRTSMQSGPLRENHATMSQAARIKAQALDRARSDSIPSDSHESGESHSPEGSAESADSSSCSSGESPIPSVPKECAPSEIMERIQHANDHLLSIIAAFIGHIHGHTRDSHASSYAFLIDMTRATVDGVRTLLVIVEAVHGCQTLQATLPRQISILWETRESVYEATAALVTAARVITSSSHQNGNPMPSPTLGAEDDDKSKLLQAATAVLRSGGECVGAVKLCLNRADPSLRILLAMPPSMHANQRAQAMTASSSSADEEDEEAGERHLEEAARQNRRAKHTLSYLGRKATSLSCLRERYEQDNDSPSRGTHFDDIAESSNESMSPTSAMPATMPSTSTAEGGDSSDSSEPMSREHSRASASTLHSARSNTTPNTSARPSIDRGERPLAHDDQPPPVTAPILGSFPRNDKPPHGVSSLPHIRNRSVSLPRPEEQARQQPSPSPATPASPSFPSPPKRTGRSLSADARILAPDYDSSEISFNSEGQLTGATLKALVEKMTPHNTTIDATLSNAFFLCFRLFTTPTELFEELESRYNMRAPTDIELSADDFTRWSELKVAPVRLRVFNFLKLWLENHWNASTDFCILERLVEFTQTSMAHSLNKPGQRLAELAHRRLEAGPNAKITTVAVTSTGGSASLTRGPGTLKRVVSTERVKGTPGMTEIANLYTPISMPKGAAAPPQPIVSKNLMGQLKSQAFNKVNIMDFDLLELARQLTIMESRIYCSILPEELLGQEFSKKAGVSNAVNVKRMSALSTHITGWVSECILGEEDARKRTQLVKFFIKLGDRCLGLNNYNALFAIQGALNSSTIARLKRTWDGLPTKYRHLMEQQRHTVEHTRNFAGYRQRLRSALPPALPFVGLFLTDLTFCHEGNAATRPSPSDPSKRLLNFDKYVKMSRIIGDLQRFQVPYTLLEVPEMQVYLRTMLEATQQANSATTAEELYRRSLRLEPRNNTSGTFSGADSTTSHTGTISGRSGLGGGVGLDIFSWK